MPEWQKDVVVEAGIVGFGLVYEANEVARCIRGKWPTCSSLTCTFAHDADGLMESKVMPHEETKMVMGVSPILSAALTW